MRGLAVLAALLLFPAGACEIVTDNEFATLTIQLTDAADEEVTEAWVTITDVYLQPGSDESDPPGGRVYVLEDGEETHELLSLENAVAFLAVGVDITAGTYEQLRLVITDGCIAVGEGEARRVYSSSVSYEYCGKRQGNLHMPSYDKSGLKIKLDGLELSGDRGILLDFDVPDSFGHPAGSSGMWVMHPVIHWTEADLTAAVFATLSAGDATLPEGIGLGDFTATLSPATGGIAESDFEDNNGDGIFEVSFRQLNPDDGPFEVKLTAPQDLGGFLLTCGPGCETVIVDPGSGEAARVDWVLASAGGGS